MMVKISLPSPQATETTFQNRRKGKILACFTIGIQSIESLQQ